MASVASSAPAVGAAPVRHGISRLTLRIGGVDYRLRRILPTPGFVAIWRLRKLDPHAAAASYVVAAYTGKTELPGCTCPDHEINGSQCKHIMALQSHGLIPTPKPPSARALRLHAKNAQAAIAQANLPEGWEPGGKAVATAPPARNHGIDGIHAREMDSHLGLSPKPARPYAEGVRSALGLENDDPARAFAEGFRGAVRDHLAGRSERGGT
jgi:hypothetical protein